MGTNQRQSAGRKKRSGPRAGTPASQDQAAAPRDWRVLLGGALVVLAIFAAYSNSLFSPFIFDDSHTIRDNPTIRRLWPIGPVLWPPLGVGLSSRPVVSLSLAVNYALGGLDVFGYHAFNLGVHIAVALALLGIVRRTLRLPAFAGRFGTSAAWYATAVALLWGLHPLNTEAVACTIQRSETMFSMFYLLTLYCCLRGHDAAGAKGWYAAAVGSCLLGMGCKEAMATAPVMVLLYDRVFVARSWKELLRRRWGLYAGLAATWILLLLLMARYWGVKGTGAGFGWGTTWWEYARTQFWAIAHYLRLAFWPTGLVVDYGNWFARAPGEIIPGAIVVAVLIAATLAAYFRQPWAGYLGTWFFAILAPSSSIVPLLGQTVAERRMYLPLAAVVALVVFLGGAAGKRLLDRTAWTEPMRRRRAGTITVAGAACLALVLGSLTFLRNRVYRSDLAIWEDAIRKRPQNPRAYFNRGCVYGDLGMRDKEMGDYDRAIALAPDCAEYYDKRGNAYVAKGDLDRALADYSKAVELKPDYAEAYNNRGAAYSHAGADDRAVADFTKALSLQPDSVVAYNNRAFAYCNLRDYEKARADVEMLETLGAKPAPELLKILEQTRAAQK